MKQNTSFVFVVSFFATLSLLVMAIFMARSNQPPDDSTNPANVAIVDGTQIIDIRAKGGYSPRSTTAKANMRTVLKMSTAGTFDCSSALVIPSIRYRKKLPITGETSIEIPPQKPGATLQGLCSMGMYGFKIRFE